MNPKDGLAHFNLARTYRQQGRIVEAVAEFKTTIELNPQSKVAQDASFIVREMLDR